MVFENERSDKKEKWDPQEAKEQEEAGIPKRIESEHVLILGE